MKIDFKKIDFRQGKYWFPLVLFVPLVAIAYFSCEMFKGPTEQTGMVTDSINTMMPEPAGDGLHVFDTVQLGKHWLYLCEVLHGVSDAVTVIS